LPLAKNDWGKEIEKKENIYNEKTLLKILRHLIKGLSIMQYKNIAHRDIKPQNILIMENDDYLLCDFDESIFVKKAFGNYDIKGTEMFICPILENCVLNGLKNTYINIYKSDMYSLGLCFVYAITKNYHIVQTIKSCNNDVLNQNLIFNNVFGGEVFSNFFIDILMKMIAFLEKDRFDFIEMDNLVNNNINDNDEKL
jgi:serine/threonine protein kinase